jgi:hypothetical protein
VRRDWSYVAGGAVLILSVGLIVLLNWFPTLQPPQIGALPWFSIPPPQIGALNPSAGRPGQLIHITGDHLRTTQSVLFAIADSVRFAKFRVVSDHDLEVTVPDARWDYATATIAVVTEAGVAVTCPPTDEVIRESDRDKVTSDFIHVMRDGTLNEASGITVIEDGGVVERVIRGPWAFVRNGGALEASSNGVDTVYLEPQAQYGPTARLAVAQKARRPTGASNAGEWSWKAWDHDDPPPAKGKGPKHVIRVKGITIALSVGPFQYTHRH